MEGVARPPSPPGFLSQVRETAEMVKIGHSVFALPFAIASAALAMRAEGGWSTRTALWIVFCAVTVARVLMLMSGYPCVSR